eukprot:jgi/Picre1/35547/NNA_003008.t1
MLWTSFDSGKVFAQRQTFWDSLFTILRARDRDWVSLLVNLLLTALVNYTVGGIMAVVTFIFSLPSSFRVMQQASRVASIFCCSSVAAVSLIAAYLALLYFSGAAVIYTTASFVNMQQRRLAYERQQRVRYGGRPHYE